ncbi:MAG: redox-regulated ATPase YchF [Chloroflexi bacterium]|nr:redox-regulated ATPase YchF [Chloroflexota bacterium]
MEIAIIGFPRSGKSTLFNALTRGNAQVATYSARVQPNVGVAKMLDGRLEPLVRLFKPERVVPAEARFLDLPGGLHGVAGEKGIAGEYLNLLQRADLLLHVVRAFDAPSVPPPEGGVDPARDLMAMEMELAFADLGILERRLQRIEQGLKGTKTQERAQVLKEQELLGGLKKALEEEVPIRAQGLSHDVMVALGSYQFLTTKPLLQAINIGEADIPRQAQLQEKMAKLNPSAMTRTVALCGQLEMELAQMSVEDAAEFRASLGLEGDGIEKALRTCFDLLGLITFFTVGPDEVRAWTVQQDSPATKAAGRIHSDIERGFIRAEVISHADLLACGSLAEARKRGLLRLEGKTYPVQDGDILTILFNV